MLKGQQQVRPARPADSSGVWPLLREFATSFQPERDVFEKTWEQLLDAPDTLVLVAEHPEGEIVGYLLASTHPTLFANGPVAWVEEIMVEAASRNSGIGRDLMNHAENWATVAGARYLALATRRAEAFYLALNYETSAIFFKKSLS